MSRIRRIVAVGAVALIAALVASCGPGPKSQQLDDLERQLQDPSAREVKDAPGANKPYREARQYRRLALEAWDEGKDGLSQEYAILGMLRYRTAVAISEQHEAKARLDAANAQVGDTNPEVRALNAEQQKLAEEVRNLEMQVAQQRRVKEEAERRAAALQSQQNMQQNDQAEQARRQRLQAKLDEARRARTAAEGVNAGTHAPAQYNPAVNTLKSVETLMANSPVSEQMIAEAAKAVELFKAARAEAEPKFNEEQEKLDPALRRQRLRADAESTFGGSNVISEPNGARVVFPASFAKGDSAIGGDKRGLFDQLAELAKKYDDFTIHVEGYTSRGDATENLGISQLRAKAVKDLLEARGIKGSRIETRGQGQDRPRYSGGDTQNDRVEVVFTR